MQLSESQKQNILQNLAQDYVPFSDVFHEICADTVSDMIMTGALNTADGQQDRVQLHNLENHYFQLIPEHYQQVIPVIEQVLTLQHKYQKLREQA